MDANSVKIKLTKGKFALVDESFKFFRNYKWTASGTNCGSFYARCHFKIDKCKYGSMQMHHCVIGKPINGMVVDHINGNTLDNRKINLRIVSVRENSSNKKINRKGKEPGIDKDGNRFRASFWVKNKHIFVGSFSTMQEAVNARNEALAQYRQATKEEGKP